MKNEENDILKMLAMQAKMRMKNGAYKSKGAPRISTRNNSITKMYVSNFSADYRLMALSKKEDEEIYNKVKQLVGEDKEILNPIKLLIDSDKYNKMDDVNKMRYVLSVSEKYRNFKSQCEKEIV